MTPGGPEIRVVTHGGLQSRAPMGPAYGPMTLDPGTTLAEVLISLGIDRGLVGVAAMDGKIVHLDAALQSDGVIDVYPIFGGG